MSDEIERAGSTTGTDGDSGAAATGAGSPSAAPKASASGAPASSAPAPAAPASSRAQRREERRQARLAEAERKEALAEARHERRAARNSRIGIAAIGVLAGIAAGVIGLLVVGSLTDTFGLKQRQPEAVESAPAPTVDTSMLTTVIEDSAQLVTATMRYDGAVRVETGAIPIINKSKFWIVYEGTVGAGIDVQQVDVEQEGNVVTVTIPHAAVTSPVQIDPSSVQFYADESPVFSDDTGDMNEAMRLAAEDMQARIDLSDLLARADDHAVAVIHQLLDSRVGDFKVEVKFQEEATEAEEADGGEESADADGTEAADGETDGADDSGEAPEADAAEEDGASDSR